jgi:hypothetical protein
MMHFFMHLHERGSVTIDEEGADFESETQARTEALRAAREIMCAELRDGKLCLDCYIEVRSAGAASFIVRFSEAVDLVRW